MLTMRTDFGTYDVYLNVSRYVADGSIYIGAWDMEEGPIASLTVCLDDKTLEEDEAYLDTNTFPFVYRFLVENGLATPTGDYRASGFCMYPKAKINVEEVMKHVYKGEQ